MTEALQALTSDTRLFHNLFDTSPVGIVVETLEGQPLFVNPAFCAFLGFTEEELRTKHCVDFSPPEDAAKDWALFQQLRAGSIDHYQLEKRYFRRDGSVVWGSLSISWVKSPPPHLIVAMVEDITAKKTAEEARSTHTAIVESSEDAILSVTLDGVITSWNAGAQRMYGYTETEAVGNSIGILVPPELPDEENRIIRMIKAGGRIQQFETVRIAKTGVRIDVSLSVSPIRDSSGEIVGFSGITRDITERRRAEEALRRSEERLRLAQQAARIGAFEWDIRAGVNTWTPELESMYGLPPGGFGRTQTAFEKLVHPDDLPGLSQLVEGAMKSGQPTYAEWRAVWPDGSVHWIAGHWQVFANEFGEPSRVLGVNMDVTERKRAEEALKQSEEKFRSVFRDAGVGMIIVSLEGQFLAANRTFCDFLGYSEDELREKTVESITLAQDWPAFSQKLRETLTNGGSFRWFEKRCLHKSGRIVYTQSSASLIRKSDGAPQYFVGEVMDVTSHKQAEEALSGMTRKLIEAQEQERARIGRELHDDINQRLAMVAVEIEQLQNDRSEVQERLQKIRKELVSISDDVQALSHELHSSKLDYLGVVAGIRSWCKEFGEHHGMNINFRADIASPISSEISLTLFRILQEAIHNAVKHSGVKQAEVHLSEHSNEIHLTIRDFGKGFEIDAAKQGRGLGLVSMEERVRLVNGTIAIESRPMGGTSIRIEIPFRPERIAQRAAG
jgi:PAS domain S-box-containing protein